MVFNATKISEIGLTSIPNSLKTISIFSKRLWRRKLSVFQIKNLALLVHYVRANLWKKKYHSATSSAICW